MYYKMVDGTCSNVRDTLVVLPAGHLAHSNAFTVVWYSPAAHSEHSVVPVWDWKRPVGHSTQGVEGS